MTQRMPHATADTRLNLQAFFRNNVNDFADVAIDHGGDLIFIKTALNYKASSSTGSKQAAAGAAHVRF